MVESVELILKATRMLTANANKGKTNANAKKNRIAVDLVHATGLSKRVNVSCRCLYKHKLPLVKVLHLIPKLKQMSIEDANENRTTVGSSYGIGIDKKVDINHGCQ